MSAINTTPLFPIISIPYARSTRVTLPQINDERAFMAYLKSLSIKHRAENFDPVDLRAVQSEINLNKAVEIARYWNPSRHIIVAVDRRIMDGHHRWWAAHILNTRIKVVQVYAPHSTLIRIANDWEGVEHHGI